MKVQIFSESEHSYAWRTLSSNLTPDISSAINVGVFLFGVFGFYFGGISFCLSSHSRLIIHFFTNVGKNCHQLIICY